MLKLLFPSLLFFLVLALNSLAVECLPNQQEFQENCYYCNPDDGYLKFNPDSREILCIQCSDGFKMENEQCILENPIVPKSKLNQNIDLIAGKVSIIFGSTELMVGYFILIVALIMLIYWLSKNV